MVDFRIIGNSSPTGTPQSTGLLYFIVQIPLLFFCQKITPIRWMSAILMLY